MKETTQMKGMKEITTFKGNWAESPVFPTFDDRSLRILVLVYKGRCAFENVKVLMR